jgi:hypothetical protein
MWSFGRSVANADSGAPQTIAMNLPATLPVLTFIPVNRDDFMPSQSPDRMRQVYSRDGSAIFLVGFGSHRSTPKNSATYESGGTPAPH